MLKPLQNIKLIIVSLFLLVTDIASAQTKYHPSDLFPAQPLLPPGNPYRTATGEPGPAYWQNKADYVIDVALDDKTNVITGTATITYTNNSPKALSALWLQLEQNVFKKDSRGIQSKLFLYQDPEKTTPGGGYQVEGVQLTGNKAGNIKYHIYDTRMQLELAQPLLSGQAISFNIRYRYNFPVNYKNADFLVNRTDILPTKNGNIYAVAQWYPQDVCVR